MFWCLNIEFLRDIEDVLMTSVLCGEVWRGSTSRSASEVADMANRTFFNCPPSRCEHTPSRPRVDAGLMRSVLRFLHALCGGVLWEAVQPVIVRRLLFMCLSGKHEVSCRDYNLHLSPVKTCFSASGRLMTCLCSLKPPRTYLLCGTRRRTHKLLRCKYSEP